MSIGMRTGKKSSSGRRFSGGGPRPDNNDLKRTEAAARNAAWAALSPQEQLKSLDRRPGASTKQRARIQARINKPKVQLPAPSMAADAPPSPKTRAKDRHASEQAERPGQQRR